MWLLLTIQEASSRDRFITSMFNRLLTLGLVVLVDLQHLHLLLLSVLPQYILKFQVQLLLLSLVHQLLLFTSTRYLLHQGCVLFLMTASELLLQMLCFGIEVARVLMGNLSLELFY